MKKKTEKAYFNDQWEQMVLHLNAFIGAGDQEELHLFRVQVKKVRALLELLDTASSKSKLTKDFKPIRQIFKHCGIIRNAYINLQLGIKYQFENEEFLMGQQYEIEKSTQEVKESGKKYRKTIKSAHRAIGDALKKMDDRVIIGFYQKKLDQVANLLDQLKFDETLHNARRQVKTLLYNRKIAFEALDGKLDVNNSYLDKLQGLIGDWHDNVLALELFSTIQAGDAPVVAKIKRQNTRLQRSIAVLTQEFMKKAVVTQN